MANIEEKIASSLRAKPGQTARQLAAEFGVDKSQINSLLYGKLKGAFRQDTKYRWWPVDGVSSAESEAGGDTAYADTPLARLARYYMACLGQDDAGEVSVWARSNFEYDYVQLDSIPEESIHAVLQEEEPRRLLNAMHRDRASKIMYLGYPVCINRFTSKSGNIIHRLEPVLMLPVQFEGDKNRGTASLAMDFPMVNTAVLRRYTNADADTLMNELIELEKELGFGEAGVEVPELDEVAQRLQLVRAEWPWKEQCDPDNLVTDPPIHQLEEPGIYNRAILLTAERKPFTQGLEAELRDLAKLDDSQYSNTALGKIIHGRIAGSAVASEQQEPLIEVLPMNSEQRLAIERALTQSLTIITGPPGTGKSQVVTNLLVNAAWQGKKVLFASKNNKAVDVVEVRVNNLGPRPLLLRMGSNEYQVKLRDYLQALLAATASDDDKLEYEDAVARHRNLVEKTGAIQYSLQQVIESRNRVDELEQRVEDIRKSFGDDLFRVVRLLDSKKLNLQFGAFRKAIVEADKNNQGFIGRLTWAVHQAGRYDRLRSASDQLAWAFHAIGVDPPHWLPNDDTFPQWKDFCRESDGKIRLVNDVSEYFTALECLQKQPTLEDMNGQFRSVMEEISDNSEALWASWLRVTPSRLSQDDRMLLSQYVSVLQMITDSRGEKVSSKIWAQYYELTRKVSHLLPCWAVTSLSARGKLPFSPGYFDIVVFDEASQCDIASALPLLYRAKQVVVIGDPMQLSHISGIHKHQDQQLMERFSLQEDFLQWAYSWNSLFDMASSYAAGADIVNLKDHHRSHADIINFSNNFFYEGRLRVATRYDRLVQPSRDVPGIRWVDCKGKTIKPSTGGAVNKPEAEAIVSELRKLVLENGYRGTIGVVSPFRAQASLIRELCVANTALQSALDEQDFISDTVHRFQGDERDLIIFSPVISDGAGSNATGFLRRNGNLFNVAITRARAMLLVVGDKAVSKSCAVEYLEEFARYVDTLENQSARLEQNIHDRDLGALYPVSVDRSKVSEWEIILYEALYKEGIHTIPQYAIEQYVLDFALVDGERRLDIEVDGERYHRSWTGELCRRDQIRNQRMYELGWDVMRFWVYEVRDDLSGCVARVMKWLENKHP